ncbi:xdhC family protein [Halosimplex carlsbadense 2-9-1]|uniref:XdhC family protein n=1 Tax=Halosimplex carlsbadense 2-9-1 TaxID=797114 RepID=M0C9Q2_9EURY|nr:XdhC/CoxI family protein [Halosimplex carlsbadense]ELZ19965.1 xdhC family protein [Halosimplex carlsbadense 2-9-1]
MTEDAAGDPWRVTEKDFRAQVRTSRRTGRAAAVVTVATVEGSAYRRPGAKMLVPADGGTVGAVTAGCLEDPVVDLAREVIEAGRPRLETFDLMDSGDDSWGLGLGCNGVIDLLVEPLDASLDHPLATLADGEPSTVLTVVDSADDRHVGNRLVVDPDGTRREVSDREPVPGAVRDAVAGTVDRLHGTGEARTVAVETDGGSTTVLVDSLQPLAELLIFGSQNDLPPLAGLAADVGFRVSVHSPRGAVDEGTFPSADAVTTGHPSTVADSVRADEHTYAVVMSHNLVDDRIAVETLLTETGVPYVGLMGPRARFEELRESMAEGGEPLPQSALDRLSTPVGLDLGGGEPMEIALSVVSEVLAVSNGREGGRLRDHDGPIHPRMSDE